MGYLVFETLEGQTHHITAHTQGFYVNKSVLTWFNFFFFQINIWLLFNLLSSISPNVRLRRSTNTTFDPLPAKVSFSAHSLMNLLEAASPALKRAFAKIKEEK